MHIDPFVKSVTDRFKEIRGRWDAISNRWSFKLSYLNELTTILEEEIMIKHKGSVAQVREFEPTEKRAQYFRK